MTLDGRSLGAVEGARWALWRARWPLCGHLMATWVALYGAGRCWVCAVNNAAGGAGDAAEGAVAALCVLLVTPCCVAGDHVSGAVGASVGATGRCCR